MQIIQTNNFAKTYKKLHKNQLIDTNKAIREIIDNPFIGEQKKGDLSCVYVYKFKMVNTQALLAYTYDNDSIILTFIALAPHENFYKKIKR